LRRLGDVLTVALQALGGQLRRPRFVHMPSLVGDLRFQLADAVCLKRHWHQGSHHTDQRLPGFDIHELCDASGADH